MQPLRPIGAGSVATIKLPLLCQFLSEVGNLKIICTSSAEHFLRGLALPPGVPIFKASDAAGPCTHRS